MQIIRPKTFHYFNANDTTELSRQSIAFLGRSAQRTVTFYSRIYSTIAAKITTDYYNALIAPFLKQKSGYTAVDKVVNLSLGLQKDHDYFSVVGSAQQGREPSSPYLYCAKMPRLYFTKKATFPNNAIQRPTYEAQTLLLIQHYLIAQQYDKLILQLNLIEDQAKVQIIKVYLDNVKLSVELFFKALKELKVDTIYDSCLSNWMYLSIKEITEHKDRFILRQILDPYYGSLNNSEDPLLNFRVWVTQGPTEATIIWVRNTGLYRTITLKDLKEDLPELLGTQFFNKEGEFWDKFEEKLYPIHKPLPSFYELKDIAQKEEQIHQLMLQDEKFNHLSFITSV